MIDIISSKLLILVIVALIVVGPKDLPVLLRTVGKYLGVVRRQAAEFRAQCRCLGLYAVVVQTTVPQS